MGRLLGRQPDLTACCAALLLPFVILAVVVVHIMALHRFGSNNPLGIDTKGPQDTIPFHPYYTVKDMFGLGIFMMFYAFWVFWAPNALGDPVNYELANPLSTPEHIVPEWYYLPFYAILRSIPDKLTGVIAMGASIIVCSSCLARPFAVRAGTYRRSSSGSSGCGVRMRHPDVLRQVSAGILRMRSRARSSTRTTFTERVAECRASRMSRRSRRRRNVGVTRRRILRHQDRAPRPAGHALLLATS